MLDSIRVEGTQSLCRVSRGVGCCSYEVYVVPGMSLNTVLCEYLLWITPCVEQAIAKRHTWDPEKSTVLLPYVVSTKQDCSAMSVAIRASCVTTRRTNNCEQDACRSIRQIIAMHREKNPTKLRLRGLGYYYYCCYGAKHSREWRSR